MEVLRCEDSEFRFLTKNIETYIHLFVLYPKINADDAKTHFWAVIESSNLYHKLPDLTRS